MSEPGELFLPADRLGVAGVLDLDPAAEGRVGRVAAPFVFGDDALEVLLARRAVKLRPLSIDVIRVENLSAVADQLAQRRFF